jgi:protease I
VKVAFLAAPLGAEQSALTSPWQAVYEAGGSPHLISTRPGRLQAFHHLDRGDTFPVDESLANATAVDYDALVLPGGVANSDFLRLDAPAIRFTSAFFDAGKPVAAICHAPWLLIETGVLPGRTLTSWPSLRTDLRNAGATWVDEPVHLCTAGPNTLISSRSPDDLPAFDDALATVLRHL